MISRIGSFIKIWKKKKYFSKTGFDYEEYSMKIINEPDRYAMESKLKIKLPAVIAFLSPTMVFVLSIGRDG